MCKQWSVLKYQLLEKRHLLKEENTMYNTPSGAILTYKIKKNGYVIYFNDRLCIKQFEPYAKLFVPNGTYEDNAKKQCEELCKPVEPVVKDDKLSEVYSALDDLAQSVDSLANKGE